MPIISTVEGNLITLAQSGKYTEIAHGANCFCIFGAGIAPQIAKAFPEAEVADNRTERGDKNKLGTFSFADLIKAGCETLTVYNLYTQYGTGGRAKGEPDIDYEALRGAFILLNEDVKKMGKGSASLENGWYSFAGVEQLCGIPAIGAGLAGGCWSKIEAIINEVTPNMQIELVVYNGS